MMMQQHQKVQSACSTTLCIETHYLCKEQEDNGARIKTFLCSPNSRWDAEMRPLPSSSSAIIFVVSSQFSLVSPSLTPSQSRVQVISDSRFLFLSSRRLKNKNKIWSWRVALAAKTCTGLGAGCWSGQQAGK